MKRVIGAGAADLERTSRKVLATAEHRPEARGYGRRMKLNPKVNRMDNESVLRPIERRVVQLSDGGIDNIEIARRFQRSPEFIRRVIEMAGFPGRTAQAGKSLSSDDHVLRPVERCILGWIDRGAEAADIASRLRRSTNYVERVEDLARYKLALH
jgi:hypothetical protein